MAARIKDATAGQQTLSTAWAKTIVKREGVEQPLLQVPQPAPGSASVEGKPPHAISKVVARPERMRNKFARAAYRASGKAKAYEKLPKRIAATKARRARPDSNAHDKAYEKLPKEKATKKAFDALPKRKAAKKAFEKLPKGIAAKKARRARPDSKAHDKAYDALPKRKSSYEGI